MAKMVLANNVAWGQYKKYSKTLRTLDAESDFALTKYNTAQICSYREGELELMEIYQKHNNIREIESEMARKSR